MRDVRVGTALLVLIWLAACAPKAELLLHRHHRQNYALTDPELKTVQFRVESDVLVREIGEGSGSVTLVRGGTPGLATETGPAWIRVRFTADGPGVFFAAEGPDQESVYALATATANQPDPVRVKDAPGRTLRVGTRTFEVIQGADARLLVDSEDLRRLIESRVLGKGVRQ